MFLLLKHCTFAVVLCMHAHVCVFPCVSGYAYLYMYGSQRILLDASPSLLPCLIEGILLFNADYARLLVGGSPVFTFHLITGMLGKQMPTAVSSF